MPTNIEIKARAADWDGQLAAAKALADRTEELEQEDTFFPCPNGRLKLRDLGSDGGGYLIFYQRPDQPGPKASVYETAPVPDIAAMTRTLAGALGLGKTVRKRRTVLFVGQTRVHFDDVESLGRFIELEVCLKPGQPHGDGAAIARELMAKLRIASSDLLDAAYIELLPS